jgi:hypothetical protein
MSHIVVISEIVPPQIDYHDLWKTRQRKAPAPAD